jgi:hypothetical protein
MQSVGSGKMTPVDSFVARGVAPVATPTPPID